MDPLTPKKILITGGCGFIGLNLVKFLLRKVCNNITILDNLSVGSTENLESLLSELGTYKRKKGKSKFLYTLSLTPSIFNPDLSPSLELLVGDIRDKKTCIEATKGIHSVVHLAAHAGIIPSIENPFFDFEVNILGTLNLLDASVKNKVDRFIFASSNAPLGDQIPPLNEEKVPKPLSPYGASKLAAEAYCSAFYGSYGLKTVVLRFSNAYGPYSLHKNSVIAKFIKDGILKEKLTIYGDGSQTRDFIYADDLCSAIHSLLTFDSSLFTESIFGQTFHIGTGKETSIINVANYTKKLFRNNVELLFEPQRKGEIKRNYSDVRKAREMFGFRPKVRIRGGLRDVREWFLKQGIENIKNSRFLSGSD